ncbi:hypothetical protein Hanom_Chr04g00301871 [Helianthus anomalus]
MNGRNNKNGTDIGKIGDLSIKYRSYIGQISYNIADIIVTDILTNILYRYLGRGPITNISLIYRDINYIDGKYTYKSKHTNKPRIISLIEKGALEARVCAFCYIRRKLYMRRIRMLYIEIFRLHM